MCDNELVMACCHPIPEGAPPLEGHDLEHLLHHAEGWELREGFLSGVFEFEDFFQTMAFVNAVAWISHREDHYPEMIVRSQSCTLRYRTPAVDGLSQNDFICAAKVDHLVED